MGQLYRNSKVKFPLPCVGVCVSVSPRREVLIGQLTESALVSEQSFPFDVFHRIFLAEPSPVFANTLPFLFQHVGADPSLTLDWDVFDTGQDRR